MTLEIIKALLTGFIAAVPLGPVLMLVVQKTMRHGRWKGFVTGLGSMVADTVYAGIAMLALGVVSEFVDDHTSLILIIGGVVVMLVGVVMACRQTPPGEEGEENRYTAVGYAFQAMLCAFSNPGVLALILACMAFFRLDAGSTVTPSWLLLCCVAAGEACYWFLLTKLVSKTLHFSPRVLVNLSRIFGCVIAVLGLVLSVKGLLMMFA